MVNVQQSQTSFEKKLSKGKKDFVQTWNEDAVRFPQSIAIDSAVLKKYFKEDATLVRDILVFMAMNMKRNLFGPYTLINITEFAKVMGYDPSNLKRTRSGLTDPPVVNGHVCDGYFDYVLFQMQARSIMVENHYKGKFSRDAFLLVKRLEIYTASRGKIIYDIRLSEEITDSIIQEYFVISLKDYVTAGKLNKRDSQTIGVARNLYLFLIQGVHLARFQKQKGMPACYETTVDVISKAIGFSMNRAGSDRKFYIDKNLQKLSKLEHMKFTYEFFGEKTKYHIRFYYSEETMELYEKETERKLFTMLFKSLLSKYVSLYKNEKWFTEDTKISSFHGWLSRTDKDYDKKIAVFNDCFLKVYQIQYTDMDVEWSQALITQGFSNMIEKYQKAEAKSNALPENK